MEKENKSQSSKKVTKRRKKKVVKNNEHDADPIEICPITGNIPLRFYL